MLCGVDRTLRRGEAKVTFVPGADIHGFPRRHGFSYFAQLLSLFREEPMERRLAAILVADVLATAAS